MHNTSEQFYNYLSRVILDFLQVRKLAGGERFNLYLEKASTVSHLYEAIKTNSKYQVSPFSYKHKTGTKKYNSFTVDLENRKLLVVSSNKDTTENFITTIRNEVAKQENKFQDTSLLIIYSGKLDSIAGGTESLLKEGMPLNILSFKLKILNTLEKNNTLEKHEKKIIEVLLERVTENTHIDTCSIFDYEHIVGVIHKGKIDVIDYAKLGIFPHKELESQTTRKEIIIENYEVFERIEHVFKHGDPENDFDKLLSDNGKREIIKSKENWVETDFSKINKWIEDRKKTDPPQFLEIPKNETSSGIYTWERANGYSPAQKRKRNVIIFNPINDYPFEVFFKFDKPIKSDPLRSGKDDNIDLSASGHRIKAVFHKGKIGRWIGYADKQSGKKYDIKIIILPFEEYMLDGIQKIFTVHNGVIQVPTAGVLSFNKGASETVDYVLEPNESYTLSKETTFNFKVDEESIEDIFYFNVSYKDVVIPFNIITEERPLEPINGIKVWKLKRELNKKFDFSFEENKNNIKLITQTQEYTVSKNFREKLVWEYRINQSNGFYWSLDENNSPTKIDIKLPESIKDSFDEYKSLFKGNDLPSLIPLDEDSIKIARKYVKTFNNYISDLDENQPLNTESHNLIKLGVLKENNSFKHFYFTPFHPLIVAYQIELYETVGKESIYEAILKRLNPINLLPYLKWGEESRIYTPIEDSSIPEWIKYTDKSQQKKGLSKEFVRKLIKEKLLEFTKHFSYLFINPLSPIKLNVFNLGDCKEILQGLFDYYEILLTKRKVKDIKNLPPIEINIYGSETMVLKFEELTFYNDAKEVKDKSGLKLTFRTGRIYEPDDLLNAFREKVHFYTKDHVKQSEVEYAHITFFNFSPDDMEYDSNVMSQVPTGMALHGLLSDVSSEYSQHSYRTGFSTKHLSEKKGLLEETAIRYNAISRVAFTASLYEADKTLCTTIDFNIREGLSGIYDKSQWVTFIEPKVGLNFFKEEENVIIIHYSDQYNNTSGYDAITVTKKTTQYQEVIKEFLIGKKVPAELEDTKSIINLFNAVNGDWLLKLIAQNNEFPREKISLLSGIKAALVLYYNSEIVWIPVSLEELLRVSGNAGLKQSDGLFSAKNLGKKGILSDDLLLIGLSRKEGRLKMHLHPLEIKIGVNNPGVIKKAKEQGKETAKLLKEAFEIIKNKDDDNTFKVALYKNFFAKLTIINSEKFKLYNVWPKNLGNWNKVLKNYRGELLNNEFDIDVSLEEFIGEFGIISFSKNVFKRNLEFEESHTFITFLENDGYEFLVKNVDELFLMFQENPSSIDKTLLLSSKINKDEIGNSVQDLSSSNGKSENSISALPIETELPNSNNLAERPLEILFGHNVNNQKPIRWYPTTTSKVLHTNTGIIGTMGTGKTQFTKSVITQFVWESKYNIDGMPLGILIFDYKGDYIKDDFVKATKAKIYSLHKLPYNPLALDLHENALPMLPLHTASSIKETISTAYNLGNKQQQALRDAIMNAYEARGIDKNDKSTWTNASPTISDVCELYLSDENINQDSLYAALSTLNDFEIFEPDSSKTKSLFDLLDGVVVINLSGYDESIQNLVVAITLDLFYTQMQKEGHSKIRGDFRQLNKMILVDEADNFLSKNFKSIRKILKEGREFGVGTILSTQFLSHFSTSDNDYSAYILTWIVHRVNEIKSREVEALFQLDSKYAVNELMNEIKSLDKHFSIVNLSGSNPLFIKDRAFWELIKEDS